jgi:uncharacterized membrane protein HdeD (DUF308 family)
MCTTEERIVAAELRQELASFRRNWPWFVLLGLGLVFAGFIALRAVWIASLATAAVIGGLLAASGVVEIVGAFWSRGWSRVLSHLLSCLLSLAVGVLFLWAPADAVLALTLLLACLLTVGGVFKISAALVYRFEGWGWTLVSGGAAGDCCSASAETAMTEHYIAEAGLTRQVQQAARQVVCGRVSGCF